MALTSLTPGAPLATDGVSHANEASALARWTRSWTSGTALQVQGYHTRMRRDEPIIQFIESTSDIDAQYETRLGSHHSLMLGGGYRHVDVSVITP